MAAIGSHSSRTKRGRELNAPCPEAPRSACYTSAPSRALAGACSVGCVTGLENSRFSGQPVAVATQNCCSVVLFDQFCVFLLVAAQCSHSLLPEQAFRHIPRCLTAHHVAPDTFCPWGVLPAPFCSRNCRFRGQQPKLRESVRFSPYLLAQGFKLIHHPAVSPILVNPSSQTWAKPVGPATTPSTRRRRRQRGLQRVHSTCGPGIRQPSFPAEKSR